MIKRSAEATIKGYYYQFDTTIIKLLDLRRNSDRITVEGIEDIDIKTATEQSTIQCKYLSKPKFINSAVREPIILMLDHFINSSSKSLIYTLYAHFEDEIPGKEPTINIKMIKEILTFRVDKIIKHYEIEKGISDTQLNAFLHHFRFAFGIEFYKQQQQVIDKLRTHFNCSDFEADTLYYNNALRIILDKSINKNSVERVISKSDFISGINCSRRLYNEWFIKLRSKKEYLKNLSQNIKSTRALEPPKSKIVLIGKKVLTEKYPELPLLSFIENLLNKYYKPNYSLRDAKPICLILDLEREEILSVKRNLIENEIQFNDGYEEIKFSSELFNKEPVINKSNNGARILKSSYSLKLISKSIFEANFLSIKSPSAFFVFDDEDFPKKFETGQFFEIKYCDNLKDIQRILIP